jgi:hypothetical protein
VSDAGSIRSAVLDKSFDGNMIGRYCFNCTAGVMNYFSTYPEKCYEVI